MSTGCKQESNTHLLQQSLVFVETFHHPNLPPDSLCGHPTTGDPLKDPYVIFISPKCAYVSKRFEKRLTQLIINCIHRPCALLVLTCQAVCREGLWCEVTEQREAITRRRVSDKLSFVPLPHRSELFMNKHFNQAGPVNANAEDTGRWRTTELFHLLDEHCLESSDKVMKQQIYLVDCYKTRPEPSRLLC